MDAYTTFAQVYDLFMDNVPYERISIIGFKRIWDPFRCHM